MFVGMLSDQDYKVGRTKAMVIFRSGDCNMVPIVLRVGLTSASERKVWGMESFPDIGCYCLGYCFLEMMRNLVAVANTRRPGGEVIEVLETKQAEILWATIDQIIIGSKMNEMEDE